VVAAESVVRTDALTAEDVALIRSVTDVEISPDGKQIAYILRVPRELDDHGRSRNQIWVAPANGRQPPRRYTAEKASSWSPRWSPDGKLLGFLSRRPGDDHTVVYVMPVNGGEGQPLFEPVGSVGRFAWSPDGKKIAYTTTKLTDDAQKEHDAGRDWIIDEGGGAPTRLFVVDVESGESHEAVTSGQNVVNFEWSPDGERLAVAASDKPTTDFTMMYSSLHTVDAAGGALTPLTRTEGKLGRISWSPDGKRIAFLGASDLHDPTAGIVHVVPSSGGDAKPLTADLEATGANLGWSGNNTIVFLANEGTRTTVNTIPAAGGTRKTLISSGPICHDFSLNARGGIACSGDTPMHPTEVFSGTLGGRRLARVTVSNPDLETRKLGEQEVVRWKAADGLELEGVLIKPVEFESGKAYPLAILPHGGPEGVSLNGWTTRATYPGQSFATAGYVVLMPNYRGSQGRGVAFGKADQGDLGGKEFEDVLAAMDYLAGEGLVDPNRVGMGGWSYGGYFSGLAATLHTDRFKAAMIGAAVINWVSFTGTTEIEHENSLVHWNLWPWDDPTLPWERSPLAHIKGSKTASLVVHGMADNRVPPGQALEIYRGLKHHGAPTQLVMYPREPHGLVENVHSVDFINRFVAWFNAHVRDAAAAPAAEAAPAAGAASAEAKPAAEPPKAEPAAKAGKPAEAAPAKKKPE
jgi:dipeptidyl aminopeptidase/acylaminoacyl peptidase